MAYAKHHSGYHGRETTVCLALGTKLHVQAKKSCPKKNHECEKIRTKARKDKWKKTSIIELSYILLVMPE